MEVLAAGVAGSLFGYNRENFFFDGEQRLKREYQGQAMRVKQFELFREDVRDLMELTVAKMDNYLIVNTIQIGLVVVLFTEGRPRPGTSPPWLLFLWATSGAGSFMYLLLCIWLAMHASISSHSFGVRMLTQFVRLPVPTKDQLDAARAYATDYEGARVRDMLRVPVVKQQLKKLNSMMENVTVQDEPSGAGLPSFASAGSDAASDAAVEDAMVDEDGRPVQTSTLKHVKMYRQLQANWQAYDAYARVSMAMGTNQLLQCLAYTCLMGFVSVNSSAVPGVCAVTIFSVCASLLIRLDLYVPPAVLALAAMLNILPPTLAGICLTLVLSPRAESTSVRLLGESLVPVIMTLHILWLILLLKLAQAKTYNGIALPTNFRSVLYLDVFGWLSSAGSQDEQEPSSVAVATAAAAGEAAAVGQSTREEPSSVAVATAAAAGEAAADGQSTREAMPQRPPRQLSIVREEESMPPTPRAPHLQVQVPFVRSLSGPSEDQHNNLRASLASLCWDMKVDVERDIFCFEAEDVQAMLESYDVQAVQELRRHFNSLTASLREAAPEAASDAHGRGQASGVPVWLKLEWNPSGNAMEFFHRCGAKDGGVVWTRPPPPDVVLEIPEIRHRLGILEEKVQILISEFQSSCPDAPVMEENSVPSASASDWDGIGPSRLRAFTSGTGSHSSSASTNDLVDALRNALPDEADQAQSAEDPAQEVRYGGSEAVQLADSVGGAFGAHPEDAEASGGGGFHPHRPRAVSSHQPRTRQRNRTPGYLPWSTVQRGSLVLILAWFIGLAWSTLRLVTDVADIMKPPKPTPPDLELLFAGPWPHEFLEPAGLACRVEEHGALPTLLLAEKHAVHELRARGGNWTLGEATLEARCLSRAPEFHSQGIRGVTLECMRGKACSSLLLGTDGESALRCDAGTPGELRLFGGPWQPAASGDGARLWAQRHGAEGRPTLLEPRPVLEGGLGQDGPVDLVPSLELDAAPSQHRHAAVWLDTLEGGGLLALEEGGELRAWLPEASAASPWVASGWSHSLPAELGLRWSGMCVANGAAFVVGKGAGGRSLGTTQVWKVQLPESVSRL